MKKYLKTIIKSYEGKINPILMIMEYLKNVLIVHVY